MAEKEYIEREAIQKRINRIVDVNNLRTDLAWFTPYGVNALIREIPAADVQPVVRAKWKDDWETGCSECSACGESYLWEDYDGVGEWNFCPNCGADMREEN